MFPFEAKDWKEIFNEKIHNYCDILLYAFTLKDIITCNGIFWAFWMMLKKKLIFCTVNIL